MARASSTVSFSAGRLQPPSKAPYPYNRGLSLFPLLLYTTPVLLAETPGNTSYKPKAPCVHVRRGLSLLVYTTV